MKNRMLWKGYLLGVLLIASSVVFAAGAHDKPILLVPVAPAPSGPPPSPAEQFQELPYSSVSFRWNNNNPEAQIDKIRFSMRETIAYGSYSQGDDVGLCQWNTLYFVDKEQTSFESSECQGGELKPNQWYKWIVMLEFVDGSRSLGKSAWFKTGPKNRRVKIYLEMDKYSTVQWRNWLSGVERQGGTHTLESIFKTAGIDVVVVKDEPDIPSIRPDGNYSLTEIYGIPQIYMNRTPPSVGMWHIHSTLIPRSSDEDTRDAYGTTFPWNPVPSITQYSFVVFSGVIDDAIEAMGETYITNDQLHMFTTAHEFGHALCLDHSDGDAAELIWCDSSGTECLGRRLHAFEGTTIMNEPDDLSLTKWQYAWSTSSLWHFYGHNLEFWKPNKPIYNPCHTYVLE